MKVGIFETEHFEGAYPVIKLFDMPGNQLVIFTTPATYKRFADLFRENVSRYEWVIVHPKPRLQFFSSLYRAARSRQLNLFYFNTISNNHIFFAMVMARLPQMRIVLTLHDINCMFNSRWSFAPRELAHHIGKKRLLKYVGEFNVVSDTMVDYLHTKTGDQRPVHNVPGAVFENDQTPVTIREYIHLVVPGSIDKKRRDYNTVFDLLHLAEQKQWPLQITLLGGYTDAYGKEIVEKAKSFKTNHTRLQFYDTDVVHQDEFDRQLNNAHFIYIPSVVQTAICFDIPETYGLTKSSGNIFDVIKHAKPFIAPQNLRISATLESSCFKYNSLNDLGEFLTGLWSHKAGYAQWQEQALTNSMKYTVAKVRERNPTLFEATHDA